MIPLPVMEQLMSTHLSVYRPFAGHAAASACMRVWNLKANAFAITSRRLGSAST